MSRERLFDALWWVVYGALAGLGLFAGGVAGAALAEPPTVVIEQRRLSPGTQEPGAPIFQCTGAGDSGFSVFGAEDASSLIVWCDKVKS